MPAAKTPYPYVKGLAGDESALLPRRHQLPVALRVDLLLQPRQHVLRSDGSFTRDGYALLPTGQLCRDALHGEIVQFRFYFTFAHVAGCRTQFG